MLTESLNWRGAGRLVLRQCLRIRKARQFLRCRTSCPSTYVANWTLVLPYENNPLGLIPGSNDRLDPPKYLKSCNKSVRPNESLVDVR